MKRIVTFIMAVIMIATLANPSTVDAATNAKLSKKKVTLTITNKKKNPSVTLKVKGTSKKAAKKAKWTTSNKKVVKISKGKITAKKPGKATITCKVGKKKLKCNVTVVDKRKARAAKEDEEDDNGRDGKCTDNPNDLDHEWVAHWASYDNSGSYRRSDIVDHVCTCNCGRFLSVAEKEAHWKKVHSKMAGHGDNVVDGPYFIDDVRGGIGLHSSGVRPSGTEEEKWVDGELVTYWTIHADYVDYMDCAKCGKHIVAFDLPEGYGI